MIPWLKTLRSFRLRTPAPPPLQPCTGRWHYGVYHNSETDTIVCTGCHREWVPRG